MASNHRRRHLKSRAGCRTCKERHIKCDEFRPECRNCTTACRVCEYPDTKCHPTKDNDSNHLWPSVIEERCKVWVNAGEGSADLPLPAYFGWFPFEGEDLRHMYHVCLMTSSLELSNTLRAAIWAAELPVFLRLSSYDYVAYGLMGLSACRLAWATRSLEADKLARRYQQIAYHGACSAMNNMSSANIDAILATLILLSTEVEGWYVSSASQRDGQV
ncbi:hypothetical protein LEMA_P088770.1 [Paecilomyces variotii No. 5]|uniref:Zn(2)-C6 fungal-type domain-containing protein n=1 Tax=Byssochlamys spectabilis (strain No. 5 / NBRC 109023) TaxID=1356009 RepID=V5FVS4_BYSSN|nr:hypothetical protein LEMA_P088770.1 [Paecilomyces variotii No. 5]